MKKVYLVDGSSIFFRAYHAISGLRRSDGTATNALYGYLLALRSLFNEHNPECVTVAFDRPEKTFRKELYEAYKANRTAPPEELNAQVPYIKQVTDYLGVSRIEMAGHEADDLIGSMTDWLEKNGAEVVIVSADKDLLQLLGPRVAMLRLAPGNKSVMYTPARVKERYGVGPEQFIDVLALMGDSSDNIPGVPGIGEKTASALIQEFGSLDGVYGNLGAVKGKKRKESLEQYKDQAYLSRQLVTIKRDIGLDWPSFEFKRGPAKTGELRKFYAEMEFRTFLEDLGEAEQPDEAAADIGPEADYQTIADMDQLDRMIREILERKRVAVDTETTSLHIRDAALVGLSFTVEARQGWYVPLGHAEGGNLPAREALEKLRAVFESEEAEKIAHHSKYDAGVLLNAGIELKEPLRDTLIASFLLQPEFQNHKLDDLALRMLGMQLTPISDLIGTGKNRICMADVPVEKASPYACEDTDAAWRLWEAFEPRLNGDESLFALYRDVEMPLAATLAGMERRGIMVDPEVLREQSAELEKELAALERDIHASAGREFNLNSPKQLSEILYDDLQLLKGRKRSTRADLLEKLADEGIELAQKILDYRHRQKIKSTYLDALQKLIHPETGRVHTTYHQVVTNTGRISSSDPNLQNIPVRTELGRRVRSAFTAAPGHLLVSMDYSQIELRILAHMSDDPGLVEAFRNGEDIHRRTAAEVFGVPPDGVTPDMRRKAKEINFGLNYGMSPYGLARRLGIPDTEASDYIERYFSRYPGVLNYMDGTVGYANEHLHVKTILGRKIPAPGIRDGNRNRRDAARRAAINAPIQGSAADMLKKAMVRIDAFLRERDGEASILLTVHDELVLEAREDKVDEIVGPCAEMMERALPLKVPTPVEWSKGSNWAELK